MATIGDLEQLEKVNNYKIIEKIDSTNSKTTDSFEEKVYREAKQMSDYYMLFYCLERSARDIVVGKLKAIHCGGWWATKVPQQIRESVAKNIQNEIDAGVTQRSENEIDYTTFGELGEIVKSNWADFGDIFKSVKAFSKIMTSLNILRGPIAHCSILSEDEILRLELTVKDWMRIQSN